VFLHVSAFYRHLQGALVVPRQLAIPHTTQTDSNPYPSAEHIFTYNIRQQISSLTGTQGLPEEAINCRNMQEKMVEYVIKRN
jgi:hypothetical protein